MTVLAEQNKPIEDESTETSATGVGQVALATTEARAIATEGINTSDTYAEIYANTPAKALLWEARKILDRLTGLQRDAALVEIAEAYSEIDPGEAIDLINQIKNPIVKVEGWAKFGCATGDDFAIKRAREMAGKNHEALALVSFFGHDKESAEQAFKDTTGGKDILTLLTLAQSGYTPALDRARWIAIDEVGSLTDSSHYKYRDAATLYASIALGYRDLVSAIKEVDKTVNLMPQDRRFGPESNSYIANEWAHFLSVDQAESSGEYGIESLDPGISWYLARQSYSLPESGRSESLAKSELPKEFLRLQHLYQDVTQQDIGKLFSEFQYTDYKPEVGYKDMSFRIDLRQLALIRVIKQRAIELNSES